MAKQKIIEYEGTKYIVNDTDDYTFDDNDLSKDHISYFPEYMPEPSLKELEKVFNKKISFGSAKKKLLSKKPV